LGTCVRFTTLLAVAVSQVAGVCLPDERIATKSMTKKQLRIGKLSGEESAWAQYGVESWDRQGKERGGFATTAMND